MVGLSRPAAAHHILSADAIGFMPGSHISEMKHDGLGDYRQRWSQLERWKRRLVVAAFFFIESTLGLLSQMGVLNIVDTLLFDSLPTDLVWLLQTFTLICVGFGLIKITFDDMRLGWTRSSIISTSPILLFFYILLILHILLTGLDTSASVLIDLASLGTNTLTWSSTYLSIAVGLTLTYSVQRYGNFAQSEFFMIGMYVGIALMWTNWLFPLNEIPSDGHLSWTLFPLDAVWSLRSDRNSRCDNRSPCLSWFQRSEGLSRCNDDRLHSVLLLF